MQDQLINLLLSQNSYPVNLAHEIGIENSVAVNEILKCSGFSPVAEALLIPRFNKAGIKDFFECRNRLHSIGLITCFHDEADIQLNKFWFDKKDSIHVEIKKTIYQDKEFSKLFSEWKSILIKKGVKRKNEYFEELFKDVDLDVAKKALKYSIDNKFTTLYFNERFKQNSEGNRSSYRAVPNSRTAERDGVSGKRSEEAEEPFIKVSRALEEKRFDWEFETFGDKVLINLLNSVEKWCKTHNDKKSAFTLSGPTERGKTHLLKKVENLHRRFDNYFPKRKQNYPEVTFVSWGKFTKETLDTSNYFDLVEHSGLVLIDDFLSEFYNNPPVNNWLQIVLQKAFDILNVRVGKPTFITTNLSSKEIELLDDRVHSRLFREGGEFLEIPKSLKKYLLR